MAGLLELKFAEGLVTPDEDGPLKLASESQISSERRTEEGNAWRVDCVAQEDGTNKSRPGSCGERWEGHTAVKQCLATPGSPSHGKRKS